MNSSENIPQIQIKQLINRFYNRSEEKLNLFGQILRGKWKNVLTSHNWTNLKTLNLYECQIQDHNDIKLISQMKWPHLSILKLGNNHLSEQAISQLLKNDYPSLLSLYLGCNNIGDGGAQQIFSQQLIKIKQLDISSNNLSWRSLAKMRYSLTQNIVLLNLGNNRIGSHGVKLLIKPEFPQLQEISCHFHSNNQKLKLLFFTWDYLNAYQSHYGKAKLGIKGLNIYQNLNGISAKGQ